MKWRYKQNRSQVKKQRYERCEPVLYQKNNNFEFSLTPNPFPSSVRVVDPVKTNNGHQTRPLLSPANSWLPVTFGPYCIITNVIGAAPRSRKTVSLYIKPRTVLVPLILSITVKQTVRITQKDDKQINICTKHRVWISDRFRDN